MNDIVTTPAVAQTRSCPHSTQCPPANAPDHDAARVVADCHVLGYVLLCNGVIVFDDTGELSPSGRPTSPHRPAPIHAAVSR